MKTILRGILPGSFTNDKGETFNTTRVYVDYEGTTVSGLIGSQVAELKYAGDVSTVKGLVGKPVELGFMPSGNSLKLVDIQAAR